MMRIALIGLTLSTLAGCQGPPEVQPQAEFKTGLERWIDEGFSALDGQRVGVVTNHTGVDQNLTSIVDALMEAKAVELAAVFSPEHGFRGGAQAGEKVAHSVDARTGVRVFSLYGATRRPTEAMLDGLDAVVFDIQDIGVRAYTYLSTLIEVLEACGEKDIVVWVLDRPNPLGGVTIDGPVLTAGNESFVGAHTVPLRHGLTAGEFARLVVAERAIQVDLRVVSMSSYSRSRSLVTKGRTWIAPSPNIPTPLSALVYAGAVLVEGTNLSEGRGTTRPFQLIGAPWLDPAPLLARLQRAKLPGVLFREAYFTPTFSKHKGERCRGLEIHVTDASIYRSVETALSIISFARELHAAEFAFREGMFDKLSGTSILREQIAKGESPKSIAESWRSAQESYRERRRPFLLYE